MSLNTLGKILLCNHLEDEVGDITVVYAESNKSIRNWYNVKRVNVETLENVSWIRYVYFDDQVIEPQSFDEVPAENVCFGENCGYWQIYFAYKGDRYKLERNDCKLNLEPEFHKKDLLITLFAVQKESDKQLKISVKFQIVGASATFAAVRGRPAIRGVRVRIQNNLDEDVTNANLTFSQIHSSRKHEEAFICSNRVEFEKNKIEVDGVMTSKDVVSYSCTDYNHFWRFNFTYDNHCYEMDECMNLCGKDYGFSVEITIFQQQFGSKVCIKFNMNGKVNEIPATKKESIESRRNRIIQMSRDIRGSWLSLSSYGVDIVFGLRSLARRASDRKTIAPQLRSRLFYLSSHPKLQFEEIAFRNTKLKVVSYLCDPANEVENLLKDVCEKIENFTVAWNEISASFRNLQSMIETINTDEVDELYHTVRILNDLHVVQVINVVCNVLIVSGFDELGITFYSSKQYLAREISVDPEKLAMIIEEELKVVDQTVSFLYGIGNLKVDGNQNEGIKYFVESYKPNEMDAFASLVSFRDSFLRMTELFKLIRLELICCLKSISSELHLKNRNVNITMVTYSAAGLVGGGLVVAGLALAPVTAGLSTGLVVSGIGIGAVSGGVGVGTAITDGVLTNKYLESVVYLAKNDCYVRNLISMLRAMMLKRDVIEENCDISSDGCLIPHSNSQFQTKAIAESTAGAVSNAGIIAIKTGIQVARSAVFHVGSVAVGALFDLTSLTFKSINLSKGSFCELGYKMESEALELEKELDDITFEEYCGSNDKHVCEMFYNLI